ncbi:hypothetical protein GWI33_019849 [Rhynchophorus ferrugineus]|uniref:Transposase n=1 Tax=Rhynchophorus ferrugineus TaxID=354439 RepID=A0A834M117_RHYFE|nr:hypothetical protein GWI33_019849 [Rhynchophorus ferrugineus]
MDKKEFRVLIKYCFLKGKNIVEAKTWLDAEFPDIAHDEPAPKRGKTQQSAGKVMASVLWDAHGIIFIDYLEKGRTINSDYYIALLDRFKVEISEKQPHLKKK